MVSAAVEDYGFDSNVGSANFEVHNLVGNGSTHTSPKSTCCFGCCCFGCTCKFPGWRDLWEKDRRLLRAILVIIILFNIPFGRYILYPFMIFSTWIHEMCHGLTAIVVGGNIIWLNIYPNGSGLAYTAIPVTTVARVAVASAGYTGTAILGGLLLMFRRTQRGPRIGLCALGLCLLLSCACFVRNAFGLASLISMGLLLILVGCQFSSFWTGELYALVASTCCLNAINSIEVLFGTKSQEIGGVVRESDAVTVAKQLHVPYWIWATIWLCLAVFMTLLGIMLVVTDTASTNNPSSRRSMASSKTDTFHDEEEPSVEAPSIELN